MSTKKRGALVFVLLCLFAKVQAQVVSFQIIQHDSSQTEVRTSSYIIENALFDFFFDKGYVVTNSPTVSTFDEDDDLAVYNRSMIDAKIGRCKWFVVVFADYDVSASPNPKGAFLSNIKSVSWTLYDASTGRKLDSGEKIVGPVPDKKNNEKGISAFTFELAADLLESLR